MEFTRTSNPAKPDDLDALRAYAPDLPPEYLDWLALHDGSVADGTDTGYWGYGISALSDSVWLEVISDIHEAITMSTIFGFKGEEESADGIRMPQPMLCIGSDPGGNMFLLSLREDTWHEIWYWDHGNETADFDQPWWGNMHKVTDSFDDLITGGQWTEYSQLS